MKIRKQADARNRRIFWRRGVLTTAAVAGLSVFGTAQAGAMQAAASTSADIAAQSSSPAQSSSRALARAFDRLFDGTYGGDRPGLIAAVTRGEELLGVFPYGKANWEFGEDWAADVRYTFYSTTKSMVVLALIELERQGKLSLDDDMRVHLPDFPAYDEPITLRHLASHTSGLYQDEILVTLAGLGVADEPASIDELYGLTKRQKKLSHRPGAMFSYSDTAMRLLARIIEKASGKAFEDAMHELVFEPAGMKTAYVARTEPLRTKRRASTYLRAGEGVGPNGGEAFSVLGVFVESSGDGASVGTIMDYVAYLGYLRSKAPEGGRRIDALAAPVVHGPGLGGVYRLSLEAPTHRGLTYYTHGGLYGKRFAYVPELDLGLAVMTNNENEADTRRIIRDMLDAVVASEFVDDPRVKKAAAAAVKAAAAPLFDGKAAAAAFSGAYIEPQSGVTVTFGEGARGDILGESFTLTRGADGGYRTDGNSRATALWRLDAGAGRISMNHADWGAFRPLERLELSDAARARVDLSVHEGAYYSSELGVLYHVAACDGMLQMEIGAGAQEEYRLFLSPVSGGYFAVLPGDAAALRGQDMALTAKFAKPEAAGPALELNLYGIRGLTFERLPGSAAVPVRQCRTAARD